MNFSLKQSEGSITPSRNQTSRGKNPPQFDALVIGTGLGGATCGALLARGGLRVLILEKNPRIGGSCSYYQKDGFHVDIGTHMFSRGNRGPIGEVQKRLGIAGAIKFRRTRHLALLKGLGIEIIYPSAAWRLPGFFLELFRKLKIPLQEYPAVVKLFYALATMSDEEITIWNEKPVEDFISGYTTNPRIIGYLGFLLGLYFVLPLREISAGEAIWCYKRMFRDNTLSYPEGGAVKVPWTFVNFALQHKGKLLTNSEVCKILIKDGSVQGVRLREGHCFYSPIVVSTTSLRQSIFRLVGPRYFPAKYIDRIKRIRGSLIAVQAKIALKRKLLRVGCIFGGTIRGPRESLRSYTVDDLHKIYYDVKGGRLPDGVAVYCPIPSNFDPRLAPPGRQLLTACTVAPPSGIRLKDPPERWKEALLGTLQELIPNLKQNILWCDTFTARDIEDWIGKGPCGAISTAQLPSQVGSQRPPHRSPIRGLYFAGDCAGGRGIGTELATQSGLECADTILTDLRYGLI